MSIGQAVSRLDGPAKVAGAARYAADTPLPDAAHAVIVPATRPKARITGFDLAAASAAPGVIGIFTHQSTPKFGEVTVPLAGETVLPLQDDRVHYEGEAVALVAADSLERATEAARLVQVFYRDEPFEMDFLAGLDRAEVAEEFFGIPLNRTMGDVAAAWAEADVRVEGTYRTADRHHSAIEPAATLAVWEDGQLLVHDATQGVVDARTCLAQALHLDPEVIRVKSEFIGGGFGGKGWGWPYQILAAMAARELGCAVKLVLTRAQSFTAHGYQPATHQTVALSARADGTLTGMRHDTVAAGAFVGAHIEAAGWDSHPLYAWPAFSTSHRLVRLDRGSPAAMRSPFGGVGLVALEIAMDELAYELGMDPLDLRLKNEAHEDPSDGLAFSSKKLRECYEKGARRFGWSRRLYPPRSMRDGRDLVGYGRRPPCYGCSASRRMRGSASTAPAKCSSRRARRTWCQGVSTILPQIAADALGVPVESAPRPIPASGGSCRRTSPAISFQ